MRGASALQQVLSERAEQPISAFVVWERVISSDITGPSSKKLGIVSDARVTQYWDPGRVLSEELVAAVLTHPARYPKAVVDGLPKVTPETIVWDVVLVYPPGVTWHDAAGAPVPPVPVYLGAPVVAAVAGLSEALDAP